MLQINLCHVDMKHVTLYLGTMSKYFVDDFRKCSYITFVIYHGDRDNNSR